MTISFHPDDPARRDAEAGRREGADQRRAACHAARRGRRAMP